MDVEYHSGAVVSDDSVGMGGEVVEQAGDLLVSVLGGFCLLGGDGADGDEGGRVDGSGVEEGGAGDGLDAKDAGFVK
jgi:hypothetical protein